MIWAAEDRCCHTRAPVSSLFSKGHFAGGEMEFSQSSRETVSEGKEELKTEELRKRKQRTFLEKPYKVVRFLKGLCLSTLMDVLWPVRDCIRH